LLLTLINIRIRKLILNMPSVETKNDEHENIETKANKSDGPPS
jgi:hypothetical protein